MLCMYRQHQGTLASCNDMSVNGVVVCLRVTIVLCMYRQHQGTLASCNDMSVNGVVVC